MTDPDRMHYRADRYPIPSQCLEGCPGHFWTEAEEDTHYRLTGHRIGWPINTARAFGWLDQPAFDEEPVPYTLDEAKRLGQAIDEPSETTGDTMSVIRRSDGPWTLLVCPECGMLTRGSDRICARHMDQGAVEIEVVPAAHLEGAVSDRDTLADAVREVLRDGRIDATSALRLSEALASPPAGGSSHPPADQPPEQPQPEQPEQPDQQPQPQPGQPQPEQPQPQPR